MTPEHAIQNEIRKVAGANQDVMLWRNNVGMGWAGKSKKVGNTRVIFDPQVLHAGLCKGSSDLIGIRRVTITQEMVGTEVGVFMAVEIKQPDEYANPEQENFIRVVHEFHGIARVLHSKEEAEDL